MGEEVILGWDKSIFRSLVVRENGIKKDVSKG